MSCDVVADRVVARNPQRPLDASTREQIRMLLQTICEQQWTETDLRCFAEAATADADRQCEEARLERLRTAQRAQLLEGPAYSEAEIQLSRIGVAAQEAFDESFSFPIGTADLTPAKPCCSYPGQVRPPAEADWFGNAVWDALGFEVREPSHFQYAYTGAALTYRAMAVGDLDCDGVTVTYVLEGDGTSGHPRTSLIRPTNAD